MEDVNCEKINKVAKTDLEDKDAFILGIKEDANIGLLTNKTNIYNSQKIKNIEKITQEGLKLNYNPSQFNGNIVDYQGNILKQSKILNQDEKDEVTPLQIYKTVNCKQFRRSQNNKQVFTGNLAVDFSKPIARGHVTMLKGIPRSGKSHFMAQTMKNHIEQQQKHFHGHSSNGTYGIYIASDFQSAEKIQQILEQSGCNNYTIYSQKTGNLDDNFFLPFAALAQANHLRQTQQKDVMFMFDNVYDHYFNELNIFTEAQQPFAPIQILKEIFVSTGNFKNNQGSFTTFLAFDTDAFKLELTREAKRLQNEAESLSDNIIDFDLKESLTLPKLQFNVKSIVFKEIHQNPLHYSLQTVLQQILNTLNSQKTSMEMQKQLGLSVDPWDYYLLHDSKIFSKMLINNAYYTPIQQLVVMGIIIQSIQQESVSQFKDNPKAVLQQIFEFCNEFRDFEDEANIFEYIEKLLERDQQELVLQHIERIHQLFMMHLKMNDKLHQYKKDYLQ